MTSNGHQLNLFGIDLAALARGWRSRMVDALNRPMFAWLGAQEAVLVIHPDRSTACYLAYQPCTRPQTPRFHALLLPEDITLHRQLALPALSPRDLHAALELEVENTSPFPIETTLWGYRRLPSPDDAGTILLVMTSSDLVQQYRAKMQDILPHRQIETWAPTPLGPVPLGDHAESPRQASERRNILFTALSIPFLAATLIALAALPVAISHHQRAQAEIVQQQLQQQTRPLREMRDHLTRTEGIISALLAEQARHPDILPILEALSATMPDGSWVERLEWQGVRLQIRGLADDATALLEQLSALPQLAEVRSSAPITRDPRTGKDRFTFDLDLRQSLVSP